MLAVAAGVVVGAGAVVSVDASAGTVVSDGGAVVVPADALGPE